MIVCLLLQYPSIDYFFRSKWVILSLTLKERAIHTCLASLLWQYPSIDNFFRSKGVFTYLLRFLFVLASSLAIPRLIISFALNGSYCCLRLKNELYMIVCCCSIPRLIISFALNGSYCRSRLKNKLYMYVWLVCCGSIPRLIISFALKEYSHTFFAFYLC